jgi:hypothetical protein
MKMTHQGACIFTEMSTIPCGVSPSNGNGRPRSSFAERDDKKKPYAPAEEGDTVPLPLTIFQSA